MDFSDEILDKLSRKSGLSKEELINRINGKANEFSGLITKEGAVYIIGKELGVEMEKADKLLKLKDITPDFKKLSVSGRVIRISPIREFVKSNGSKGRVANIYLSDGTGYVRLPLWDDQVNLVEEGLVSLNSIIEVSNAMLKENTFGELELSLGRFGSIRLVDNIHNLPSSEELLEKYFTSSPRRTFIKDIVPGSVEISGHVVQIFKSKFVFNNQENEDYMIISCILDDGTGSIRAVFFRELAEEISGLKANALVGLDFDERYKLVSKNLLGKELLVKGKVVKNTNFDRLEMVANQIKSLNVLEESRKLVDSLETIVGV